MLYDRERDKQEAVDSPLWAADEHKDKGHI